MKYILYDNIEGTILGLSVNEISDSDNSWFTVSDDAYNEILNNNGQYHIILDKANQKISEYNDITDLDIKNEYCVITIDTISKEAIISLEKEKENIITKNYEYCNIFIENGIMFTLDNGERKKYTYKIEDQINIEQILRLIDIGALNDDTGVLIKASGESEYDNVTVNQFKKLYNALLKHKYYQLFYMYQYNAYIKTIDNVNDLYRLQYETSLPDNYIQIVEDKLKNFENIER